MKTFVQAFVDGDICDNEINAYISKWKQNPGELTLAQYLGISKEDYKYWDDDPDYMHNILRNARSKAGLNSIVSPSCCEEMIKSNAITLSIEEYEDYTLFHPVWNLVCAKDYGGGDYGHTRVQARFCPHCAKAVPKVVKKKDPPKKVRHIIDGGYYCHTCDKRLNSCMCLSPIYLWKEAKE